MSKLSLLAPAKINLGLEIVGKRLDGYHNLKTIFCQVSLYDYLTVEESGVGKIVIVCNNPEVPNDERNTIYKAVNFLREKTGIKKGLKIRIEKNIPVKAGLGGGSSDGAGVLLGLNKLWKLGLSERELIEIGVRIGADVPYPLVGGTKLALGGGEIFEDLPSVSGINVVVCVPEVGVETKWAFKNVDYKQSLISDEIKKIGKRRIGRLVKAIKKTNIFEIAKNLHNDFEYWVIPKYPVIGEIKRKMIDYGALGACLTGSGSGVFGICENELKARGVYEEMKKFYSKTFLVKII